MPLIPQRITGTWLKHLSRRAYRGLGDAMRKVPWLAAPLGLLGFGLSLVLILHQAVLWGAFGQLPEAEEMLPLDLPTASSVYTVDGKLLGRFFLEERVPVTRAEVADCLVEALIATEDVRFLDHGGVDYRSLGRVLVKNVILGDHNAGGGSTLTMQLAKNLYPRWELGLWTLPVNKLREIILAQRLEQVFSKEEILMAYLNTVPFGENAFGIEMAAQRFFHIPASELQPEQAAVLVGLLKAPSYYNPRQHPGRALQRRNVVLRQMHKDGRLAGIERDSLRQKPLVLNFYYPDHHDGLAPYFMAYLRQYLARWLQAHPRADGRPWNLYTDGLRIVTPIHSRMQGYAQEAVHEEMQRIQQNFDRDWGQRGKQRAFGQLIGRKMKRLPAYRRLEEQGHHAATIDSLLRVPKPMTFFGWDSLRTEEMSVYDSLFYCETLMQTGFMALDPHSGHIRAWVGGIDHRFFQYDHVTSRRQTGSVFKPLVYAAALQQGMAPCEYIPNEKVVFSEYGDWAPENADRSYGGEYSMQGALTQSVNVVAVNLVMEVGPQQVVTLARQLGLNEDIPAVPSIALGAAEASLQEMLGAYAAFFNGGTGIRPMPVLRVEDRSGGLIWDANAQARFESVLTPSTATTMTYMMRNVVNRGTARGLRSRYGLRNEMAGKTGTTQAQTDGWFLGATPDLLAGAWVGANDPAIHFRSMARGQGAATALPIWGRFMQKLLRDEEFAALRNSRFQQLSAAQLEQMNCDDLWFPLKQSEFKTWYAEQRRKDSLMQAQ